MRWMIGRRGFVVYIHCENVLFRPKGAGQKILKKLGEFRAIITGYYGARILSPRFSTT